MKLLAGSLIALLGLVLCLNAPRAADDKEPKYTIKDVMKKAHKDGLLKKVVGGKADDDERKELVVLYVSLSENKPPKGSAEAWKQRTAKIVKAAKAVQADGTGGKALASATNCGACHKLHK